MVSQRTVIVLVAALSVWRPDPAVAQNNKFKARLTPVPVEAATVAAVTGSGSATAVLTGTSLVVSGTFEGLQTPATIARIHHGLKGIRGPVVFDLTVTKAVSGMISGTVTLTKEQVEAVRSGKLYIQIHSEKQPDGNLWGWLLPS
jgi:hypothetical protein